jgi:hypothetical protein
MEMRISSRFALNVVTVLISPIGEIWALRADLAHVNAAIKIFEASGEVETMGRYVDVYRLYKRNEQITLCKEALASGSK